MPLSLRELAGVTDFAKAGVVHMHAWRLASRFVYETKRAASRGGRFFDDKIMDWDGKCGSKLKNQTNQPRLNEAGFRPNDVVLVLL